MVVGAQEVLNKHRKIKKTPETFVNHLLYKRNSSSCYGRRETRRTPNTHGAQVLHRKDLNLENNG